MPTPNVSGFVSTTNYFDFSKNNENLTLAGASMSFNDNLSLSAAVGNDWTVKDRKSRCKPAIEVKAKYNMGQYLNTQARFREIGGTEQYRVVFGGSYKLDKNNSIYVAAHATAKNADEWKYNTGGWVGYTYKFNNGVSVSGELQQNIPLNKTTQSVGKTLGSFDSDKMFNVNISVPIN